LGLAFGLGILTLTLGISIAFTSFLPSLLLLASWWQNIHCLRSNFHTSQHSDRVLSTTTRDKHSIGTWWWNRVARSTFCQGAKSSPRAKF